MARLLLSLPPFARLWAALRPISAADCNRRNPAIAAAILERQPSPFAFRLATELIARLTLAWDMFNDSSATAKFTLFTTAAKRLGHGSRVAPLRTLRSLRRSTSNLQASSFNQCRGAGEDFDR